MKEQMTIRVSYKDLWKFCSILWFMLTLGLTIAFSVSYTLRPVKYVSTLLDPGWFLANGNCSNILLQKATTMYDGKEFSGTVRFAFDTTS
jgi:hypothetical protein